jgi:cation diffusion facilitator family transporter
MSASLKFSFNSKKQKIALLSIVVSVIILVLKWIAFYITHSIALKSDALESIVNVVASVFAFIAIRFGEEPADSEHPYGHGKIEYFSGAFEGGLITLAAIIIFYDSIKSLIEGPNLKSLEVGLFFNLGAGLLNGLLGWFLIFQGKKLNSHAVYADGKHIMSDFITTLGLIVSLAFVYFTKLVWLDSVISLVIAFYLMKTGYHLVKQAFNALLDATDFELIKKIVNSANVLRNKNIIALHELRAMRAGDYIHVDMHIVVPEFLDIKTAHEVVDNFCNQIIESIKLRGEFHSHIDPCGRNYCKQCDIENCPVRKVLCEEIPKFTIEQVTQKGAL